jgi:DNA-binding NarL/FixJ family response regulator
VVPDPGNGRLVTTIRVLVADDHPSFVRALTMLLDGEDDIEVVGTAHDGASAIAVAIECRPDVVLMDLNMPGTNGIEATREITEAVPHAAVVLLTMFDDDDSVIAAMRNGARGYLLKGARQDEIRRAVRSAHAGEAIFGPAVARRLSGFFDASSSGPRERPFPQLSNRELAVLDEVARGVDNSSVARRLHLSDKTVRNYVSTILTKIGAATRSEAIVMARNAGLGNSPDR